MSTMREQRLGTTSAGRARPNVSQFPALFPLLLDMQKLMRNLARGTEELRLDQPDLLLCASQVTKQPLSLPELCIAVRGFVFRDDQSP